MFEANPGGAPCNVLAILNRLGHKTAFIGKVGNDIFGHRLKKVLEELEIDTTQLKLSEDEIDEEFIKQGKIFHFGTLSMTHEGVRKATKKALQIEKDNGLLISFAPNLRESLWDSLETAKAQVDYGMNYCDILKISDNEIQWFTGKEDYDQGIQYLQENYHIPLILLSLGKEGKLSARA